MPETTPFLTYTELTKRSNEFVDMLLGFAAKEADNDSVASHLTQCTAILSMWGNLVAPFGFPSYQSDHEKLATKISTAASTLFKN